MGSLFAKVRKWSELAHTARCSAAMGAVVTEHGRADGRGPRFSGAEVWFILVLVAALVGAAVFLFNVVNSTPAHSPEGARDGRWAASSASWL